MLDLGEVRAPWVHVTHSDAPWVIVNTISFIKNVWTKLFNKVSFCYDSFVLNSGKANSDMKRYLNRKDITQTQGDESQSHGNQRLSIKKFS